MRVVTASAEPLAYVYINDQEELFDTDIEKHSAQGDECRARNRLSELSNMTVSHGFHQTSPILLFDCALK
jgi:hypothetical protein